MMIEPHVIKSMVGLDMRESVFTSQTVNSIATKFPNRIAALLMTNNTIQNGVRQCL